MEGSADSLPSACRSRMERPMTELSPVPESAPEGPVREHDKVFLILACFNVFALVPFLAVRDSDFVRWHARQGLTLTGLAMAYCFVWIILSFVPYLGVL